jgi:asparagine synthase (glutamine-hydrolysing)
MADAMIHRGPDDDGYHETDGLGLANRRLAIVGLADGKQPLTDEDGDVVAVVNGELFDYAERKRLLEAKGHRFATHCDAELIPHLWEESQEGMFETLRGQFAVAVWDARRRQLVLARDRFGICPLFWTRQPSLDGEWLLFASEIKALIASRLVRVAPDLTGLDQVFHFFSSPGPATCFAGIRLLPPAHYLRVDLDERGRAAPVHERAYWAMEFPERRGDHEDGDPRALTDRLERLMLTAVERRLRADVPVVSYLSGGVDSSTVSAMAARVRGEAVPAFTVQITAPRLDERDAALAVARHLGATPVVVPVGDGDVLGAYPALARAAEAPVIDTSCAALMLLAREVHRHGFKVALTGEGADEWLAGYAWYKVHRLLRGLDVIPGAGHLLRGWSYRLLGGSAPARAHIRELRESVGDHSAFHDLYSVMALARYRFLSEPTLEALRDHRPYEALDPPLDRMRRWHPLNRSVYWAGRIHLAGHLLTAKGDRVAMSASVETRYPFLDEEVFAFLARLHPRWKLRGLRDKHILRLVAERYLPRRTAWRPKGMFRAPLTSFFSRGAPAWVDQLLSEESLRRTGWFDVAEVRRWQARLREGRVRPGDRATVAPGMAGVVATQLWYHTFIDGRLADLPSAVGS